MIGADGLLLAALSGLAGAPHCLIMCGGISSSFILNASGNAARAAVAYHAGRIATYTATGAFMGLIGSFLNVAGGFVGLQSVACFLGGALIIAWTYGRYSLTFPHRWFNFGARAKPSSGAERGGGGGREWLGTFLSGLSLGLLPCGLTYAMQMNAATTGSWAEGALVLLVFGLSTVPVFVLLALFSLKLGKKQRKGMRVAGAALAYTMGILSILKGAAANGWIPSVHPWLW